MRQSVRIARTCFVASLLAACGGAPGGSDGPDPGPGTDAADASDGGLGDDAGGGDTDGGLADGGLGSDGGYRLPIGIPDPRGPAPNGADFDFLQEAPAAPSPWDDAHRTSGGFGFYYVCESCAGATDDANPYGTPARPRKTIPNQATGGALPGGSVVEVHGTIHQAYTSPYNLLTSEGADAPTATRPVFIRGVPGSEPILEHAWYLGGVSHGKAAYVILEHLKWSFAPAVGMAEGDKSSLSLGGDHLVLRHSEVKGSLYAGEVAVWGSNNVVYHNDIHDAGDLTTTADQDVHCIQVSFAHHVWVLDNQLARCTGDGVQLTNNGPSTDIHHVYVGRNVSHHHKQSGMWCKSAEHVVFSQNTVYGIVPSASSANGSAMGWQYNTVDIWILFNHIYGNTEGIGANSTNYDGREYAFVIGNLIHGNRSAGSVPCDGKGSIDAWCHAGIRLIGSDHRYVIGNTVYDNDGGIHLGTAASSFVYNNIVANVRYAGDAHVLNEGATWQLKNNLFFQAGGTIRLNLDGIVRDPAALQAQFPSLSAANVTADPMFVDAAAGDLHLQAGSPAIDAAAEPTIAVNGVDYKITDIYQGVFGVSIKVDYDGVARPLGGVVDVGAFERQ